MLPSVPSFSVFVSPDVARELEPHHHGDGDDAEPKRTLVPGDGMIPAFGSGEFSFPESPIALIAEEEEGDGDEEDGAATPPLYMARGLGIDDCDAGVGLEEADFLDFEDQAVAEDYFRKKLEEFPCHPGLLRNYARLLASKGDSLGAVDYYFRAILADPADGETLMQYAKLVWEFHHDQQRALTYFKLAAEASPDDSDVLAAYASFLWEIGDDEEKESENHNQGSEYLQEVSNSDEKRGIPSSYLGSNHSAANFTAANKSESCEPEEYFLNMIKESPSDPLLFRNYARFLYESKQDLHEAMEYYSRATSADPADGESLAMYAKLVWQLHRDRDKATQLFERAIDAVPGDCHLLAAYASFLWETEE